MKKTEKERLAELNREAPRVGDFLQESIALLRARAMRHAKGEIDKFCGNCAHLDSDARSRCNAPVPMFTKRLMSDGDLDNARHFENEWREASSCASFVFDTTARGDR